MKKNRKIKMLFAFFIAIILLIGIFWLGEKMGENQSRENNNHRKWPRNKNLTNEIKVIFSGREENGDFVFGNAKGIPLSQMREKLKILHCNKNHSQIKKLEKNQKLQVGKEFIIRFEEPDKVEKFYYTFYENNQLEILEA